MKIIDKINYEQTKDIPFYSFEYFPPKTQPGIYNLIDRVNRMANSLNPLFVDITWGAGGRSSDATLFLASYFQNYLQQDVLMHITCRCQTKDKLDYALKEAKKNNIKNLLVLRGDPPQGLEDYDYSNDPFQYAEDMIKYVRQEYGDYFGIAVAGYPTTHVESKDKETDLFYLKRKVDAGAELIITQLFYDPDEFLKFKKDCIEYGIKVPILPGILPVNNYMSFKKIISLCKLNIPDDMINEIELIKNDEEKIKEFGIKNAISIVKALLEKGVKGFHFYTMNLEKSINEIVKRMGIKREKIKKELPWTPRKFDINNVHSNNINNTNTNAKPFSPKICKPRCSDDFGSSSFKSETIRPIFWSNNEQSYISKTFYWDEFPNGIWGDSRSPAFGDNDEHLHTFGEYYKNLNISKNENMKKLWGGTVTCYQDISSVFIAFLEGKIKRIPWTQSNELQEETLSIKDFLLKLNSKGMFTINSQPNVNAADSNDKLFGWGPNDGYVYQKMYVEFFIRKELMVKLFEKLKQYKTITYQSVNVKGEHYESFSDNIVCALTWGVFPNQEIVQPTIYDSDIFLIWKDEAFEKFEEWARVYNKEEEISSKDFILKAKEELFLMTIVDNDFIKPKTEKLLLEFLSEIN